MPGETFIDVEFAQRCKTRQSICGDVFMSRKIKEEGRVISVLSDGLGSGVKASVLANLTASMALKFAGAFASVQNTASAIMDALPICEVRKISYSTFTLVDLDDDGAARFIEHGNPPIALLRGPAEVPVEKSTFTLDRWEDREIAHGEIRLNVGDRLICCSDGITQSGMGRAEMPLGWGRDAAVTFVKNMLLSNPEASSFQIANALLDQALHNDGGVARDDITCAVIHLRTPRKLMIMTGPPFVPSRDPELARIAMSFPGKKIICGGTTATIVGRILQRQIEMDLSKTDVGVPPAAKMEGIDLITEGALTLARVADLLDSNLRVDHLPNNPAGDIVRLMLTSDVVQFVVGTRINEAHQDPNIPQELDLRRNIVRRICSLLETKYLNETTVSFL